MSETRERVAGADVAVARRRGWRIAGVVALAALVAAGGYYYRSHGATPVAAPTPALAQVTVSLPLRRDVDTRLGFLGRFAAVDRVALRAQVGGTLTGIYFKDGAVVHRGDLLFTIDPRPYEIALAKAHAALASATARLDLANRELSRAEALKRSDYGTAENVDQRRYDARAAEAAIADSNARIDDARFDIAHCRITAPFTGRIGAHLVSIGSLIAGSRAATSPTTLLATIVSLDPIHLDFDMSEADYLAFARYRATGHGALGQPVAITLADHQFYRPGGVLDFVDNAIDPASGTMRARAVVPNPDLLLTPGEFARLRLQVAPPAPTLLVPDAAVLPDQDQHIVLTVAANGTVVPKPVVLGDLRGGLRVIRSGLLPTDRVVIGGLVYAAPGSKVATHPGTIAYQSVH
ncbi:MAG: efflux RND transporter periplasmic adaptor subunit [Rhodospirillales bacterium]|nr:efflux RND transporter periplasmic adaptor subunit [Rhodospirillales bacterium]